MKTIAQFRQQTHIVSEKNTKRIDGFMLYIVKMSRFAGRKEQTGK